MTLTETPSSTANRSRAEFDDIAILDEKQSGHLRHFRNIGARPPGDWGPIQSNDPTRAGDMTGYQYQLAQMADAMALAHYLHLPAAPGYFRADFDNLVTKLQHGDVWGYWFAMSQGNRLWNPALTEPQKPFWNPVDKENIMYSGHLNRTVALGAYLFDTDRYDAPDAIRFTDFQSNGFAQRTAEYSLQSLNEVIYWQLIENGYMGVACMPNSVFSSCSQFPIWGFRWQDFRDGGHRADEIHANNRKAWARFGGFRMGEETPFWWRAQQEAIVPANLMAAADPSVTAAGAEGGFESPMMASVWLYWALTPSAPEYVESLYPVMAAAMYDRDEDGGLVVLTEREMANGGEERFGRGRAVLRGDRVPPIDKYAGFDQRHAGNWGRVALLMAEMGDPNTADLLDYADAHMSPVWEDGGYYYPRRDACWEEGRFVGVTPTSGNALIPYARLTRERGLWEMYNKPWGRAHFAQPNLAEVSRDVDVARARFDDERNALVLTLRPPHGGASSLARLELANVQRQGQAWTLTVDGQTTASGGPGVVTSGEARFEGDRLVIETPVARETDVIVRWT